LFTTKAQDCAIVDLYGRKGFVSEREWFIYRFMKIFMNLFLGVGCLFIA